MRRRQTGPKRKGSSAASDGYKRQGGRGEDPFSRNAQFSNQKKKKNDFMMSKTNERWCRIFGKLSRIIPPPVSQWWKNWHNFFSIGQILPKKFLVRQKYSLCLFSKKQIDFVFFPRF